MRKVLITLLLLLSTFSSNLFAGNWMFGLTPVGTQNLKLNFKDTGDIFNYNFRTTFGYSVAVESIFENGIIELSHYRGTLTSSNHTGDKLYMANEGGDIRVTSLMRYYGKVLNDGNRIQFPLYAGAGIGKFKSGDINSFSIELGAKAGAKFYVTNTIALFSNAGFHIGFGREQYTTETYGELRPSVRRADMYLEIGVAVAIGL